jgi:hypothetical protein
MTNKNYNNSKRKMKMTNEENKSILYFIYLRYCESNPKSFDELTIEQLKIEIEHCKKLQSTDTK